MQGENQGAMTLFSTSACHLCDDAKAIVDRVVAAVPGSTYVITDISDSDVLFERYGWHIPVLRFANGGELHWPFDEAAVRARLQGLPADSGAADPG